MRYDDTAESRRQANLERIVRRALQASSPDSVLARRVQREVGNLGNSPQAVREIARKLSHEIARPVEAPGLARTLSGGTVLVR